VMDSQNQCITFPLALHSAVLCEGLCALKRASDRVTLGQSRSSRGGGTGRKAGPCQSHKSPPAPHYLRLSCVTSRTAPRAALVVIAA
jgi:hypothetical protein